MLRRYELTDEEWLRIEPLLPPENTGKQGRPRKMDRLYHEKWLSSPLTIPFYEKCGFVRSHKIPNFFTDNYDHTIYEGGVQLIDMVYLQRHI